jgi:puromycin-sensitive aminopeptidase
MVLEGVQGEVRLPSSIKWVMANAGGHGFYRVRYQSDLLDNLIGRLAQLSDLERFTMVDDAWAFVESGQLGVPKYVELTHAYRNESEQAIWQSILGGLGAVSLHVVTHEARPAFRKLVSELLFPSFERLGWQVQTGESDLTKRLRGQIVGAMGRLAEDPGVIERCRAIVAADRDKRTTSDPELVRAALFVVAANGTEADYESFMAGYRNHPTPQDELRYLQALTVFDSPELTVRTVTNAIDGTIRSQDATWVLSATFGNRRNGHAAWAEVRRSWEKVLAFPAITLRRLVEGLSALSMPEVAADVTAFFAETPLPPAAKALSQSIERLQANVALRKRESASLDDYLKRWS